MKMKRYTRMGSPHRTLMQSIVQLDYIVTQKLYKRNVDNYNFSSLYHLV